jgi:hypothetical protein
MKITKRELYKIIKEEIQSNLSEVLGEEELEERGEVPFDGAGYIGESDPDKPKEMDPRFMEIKAEMQKVLNDPLLGDDLQKQKIKELMAQLQA